MIDKMYKPPQEQIEMRERGERNAERILDALILEPWDREVVTVRPFGVETDSPDPRRVIVDIFNRAGNAALTVSYRRRFLPKGEKPGFRVRIHEQISMVWDVDDMLRILRLADDIRGQLDGLLVEYNTPKITTWLGSAVTVLGVWQEGNGAIVVKVRYAYSDDERAVPLSTLRSPGGLNEILDYLKDRFGFEPQ